MNDDDDDPRLGSILIESSQDEEVPQEADVFLYGFAPDTGWSGPAHEAGAGLLSIVPIVQQNQNAAGSAGNGNSSSGGSFTRGASSKPVGAEAVHAVFGTLPTIGPIENAEVGCSLHKLRCHWYGGLSASTLTSHEELSYTVSQCWACPLVVGGANCGMSFSNVLGLLVSASIACMHCMHTCVRVFSLF